MVVPTQSKIVVLENKPTDAVNLSDGPDATFKVKTVDIPSTIPDESIVIKTLLLSNDPAQRGWIQKDTDPERLYVAPVGKGEVMRSYGVALVIKVGGTTDTYKEGDLVLAPTGWAEYAVVKKNVCRVLTPLPELSPSVFLGTFGGSGLTAYWGLVDVLKLQPGESIVISGAGGAVGNVVVQLAKHVFGASKVVAIVGSPEKAEYVKKLGADIALNYKSPSFEDDLIEATSGYVDTYFDNVGGYILGLLVKRIKRFGRIAACGSISGYNDSSKDVFENYMEVIKNRLMIKGFIVSDYLGRSEGMQALIEAYKAGKLVIVGGETIVEVKSIEEVPKVWHRLFEGRNQGKLVTKLSD